MDWILTRDSARHRWDTQDWTRQRGKLLTKQLEKEKEADQHRSSAESELLELIEQDYRDSTESACTSTASARARVVTRWDGCRHGDAERRRGHSDDDGKAVYSGSREMRNSTDPRRRRRRAGPKRHLAAEVDASKEWTSARNSRRKAPAKSPYSANETYAANSRPSGEANQSHISLRKYYREKARVQE